MPAPGFGAALLWGEIGKQLGGWRDRNVQTRLQQKEDERINALDQRAVEWRNQDLAHREASEQTRQRERAQELSHADTVRREGIEMERWRDLRNLQDETEAEERAFKRQKELAELQAALTRQNREPREPTKPSLVQLGDGTWAWADHDNRTITPTGQTAPAKTGTGAVAQSRAGSALTALGRYEDLTKSFMQRSPLQRAAGSIGGGGGSSEVEAARNALMFEIKTMAGLGQLSGGDMEMMNELVGNPTSLRSAARDPQDALARIQQARKYLEDKAGGGAAPAAAGPTRDSAQTAAASSFMSQVRGGYRSSNPYAR